MDTDRRLLNAIEEVDRLIGKVPERFRQESYPILLEAAIRGDLRASTEVDRTDTKDGEQSDSYHDVLGRPANELLARVKPARQVSRVMLLCAHLDVRSETITTEAVRLLFVQGKLDAPRNTADALRQLVKRGFLSTTAKKGRSAVYELTEYGREYVQSQLEGSSEE